MWAYVRRNTVSIFRIYAQYEPLRVFWGLAAIVGVGALVVWARFLYFYIDGDGAGHVQSLILGAVLFNAAVRARGARRASATCSAPARSCRSAPSSACGASSCSSASRRRTTSPAPSPSRRAHDRRAPGAPAEEPVRREAVSSVTVDREGTVTGNTYDKYGSTNPVVRRLMAGFERTLDELFVQAAPQSLLDVGCGEGVLVDKWAQPHRRRPRGRHRPRRPAAAGRVGRAPGARTSSTG